ncbi:hypothetical protein EV383_6247 [Pseudonocardia sediminis]|uniref:Uncharacterized protein n=1 Tax=Pseudonocardia sediminis TaxID=1397368 RepID=A0A4Q7U8J5_PSEST|nr:hypothetical protein [Pseudonocardia sediminis]RZT75506.1 hypothetical protein EV383_6247 [Pseudonocardia sediminis]
MAPSASGYELDRAVWPPYRERVIGDTVIAESTFGRRPDGQYGTGTVVGFERYIGDPAGALVQLDHDGKVDWFPLAELYLLHPIGDRPAIS